MSSPFREPYEESLREAKPELYRQLEASGELTSHLDDVASAADKEFDSIFAELRNESPEPARIVDKAQHVHMLALQATYMVLDSILIPDDDQEAPST